MAAILYRPACVSGPIVCMLGMEEHQQLKFVLNSNRYDAVIMI